MSVRLSGSDDEIVLEIRDDGVGFDPESSIDRQGLGLASMKERARLVGGELRVESAKGKGTRVVVRVPVS